MDQSDPMINPTQLSSCRYLQQLVCSLVSTNLLTVVHAINLCRILSWAYFGHPKCPSIKQDLQHCPYFHSSRRTSAAVSHLSTQLFDVHKLHGPHSWENSLAKGTPSTLATAKSSRRRIYVSACRCGMCRDVCTSPIRLSGATSKMFTSAASSSICSRTQQHQPKPSEMPTNAAHDMEASISDHPASTNCESDAP